VKKAAKKVAQKAAKKSAKKAAKKTVTKAASPATSLVGKSAPNFTMTTDDGGTVSLKDLRGKKVVLYFYPKDDTPGCTTEACAFRDNLPKFNTAKAVIIGVSKDDTKSHAKFKAKYKLNFPLASDDSGVCEAYGVWKEKNMYGRKYMGIERSTFIIDGEGVVRAEWRKVSVGGHAEEVAKALDVL
jgi:peroxiredoxin Q/BCP